jgi:addiction module RelE/StbE family toxin
MNLVFAPQAIVDLEELHAFIARDSPARAHKVLARIRTATNRLIVFPESGRTGYVEGTRELIVPRLPYRVIYRLRDDDVVIERVLHTARQWPPVDDAEG